MANPKERVSLSQAEKIVAQDMTFVVYLTSRDEHGTPVYFLIQVAGADMPDFREALKLDGFDPERQGEVLEWGYGVPGDSQIREMKDKYKCNFDVSVNLLD